MFGTGICAQVKGASLSRLAGEELLLRLIRVAALHLLVLLGFVNLHVPYNGWWTCQSHREGHFSIFRCRAECAGLCRVRSFVRECCG